MSTTNDIREHIQEIASNIETQRGQIIRLEHKKFASVIAASVSTTALVCLWVFAAFPIEELLLLMGLALYALYNIVSSTRELSLTNDLLAQNEFYYDGIVEEAYSGKEFGPKLD